MMLVFVVVSFWVVGGSGGGLAGFVRYVGFWLPSLS